METQHFTPMRKIQLFNQ